METIKIGEQKTFKYGEQELRMVDMFAGMSYEDVLNLVFRPGDYVGIVLWVKTSAGKLAIPGYHKMSWPERVDELNKIVPWLVEKQQLITATRRLEAKEKRKLHSMCR